MRNSYSRIIVAANPSYATDSEKDFWTHFERLCDRAGWLLFKHSMRKIPEDENTLVMPARLADVSRFLGDFDGKADSGDLPSWFASEEFELILEWERRRWSLVEINDAMRLGLLKLSWHVDTIFRELRPAATIVTNKIDHGTVLFYRAAEYYGAEHVFFERSPLETFIAEPRGMFAESEIWQRYPGFENAQDFVKKGHLLCDFLSANTDGFRPQAYADAISSADLMKFPSPRVFVPFDNTLWTGWAQKDHPQGKIDNYTGMPTPSETLTIICDLVAKLGGTVFMKRHPSDREVYDVQAQNLHVIEGPIATLLSACDICVTFLTKVAFVSVAAGKPTVTLAPNTAAVSGATVHAKETGDWEQSIKKALSLEDADLALRRDKMAALLGWLEANCYVDAKLPADFGKPTPQSILENIQKSEAARNARGSLSRLGVKVSNIKILARKSKKMTNSPREALPTVKVFFDISRLANTRLEHSGISRYARKVLHGLASIPELDVVPVLFKQHILSRGRYRDDLKGFSDFLGYDVLLASEAKKLINGAPAVYFSPYDELQNSLPGVPRVVTVHDILHITMSEWYLDTKARAHIDNVLSKIKPGDYVVSDSEYTRMELVRGGYASANEVATVYLAAESDFCVASGSEIETFKSQHSLSGKPYFVLFGQFEFRKNVLTTLSAIRLAVADRGSQARFLIIGSGLNAESMRKAVDEADLPPDTFRFLSGPDDQEMAKAYSGARGTLYVSLGEGFGLPVVESLACGCPAITSALTSVPEVARDAALYVDPRSIEQIADAIIALERNDSLYERLRQAAFVAADRFSWDRTVQELADILCERAQVPTSDTQGHLNSVEVDPVSKLRAASAELLLDPVSALEKYSESAALEKLNSYVERIPSSDQDRIHFQKVWAFATKKAAKMTGM